MVVDRHSIRVQQACLRWPRLDLPILYTHAHTRLWVFCVANKEAENIVSNVFGENQVKESAPWREELWFIARENTKD